MLPWLQEPLSPTPSALLDARMVDEIRAQMRFHHQNVVQFLGLASGRPPHRPDAEHWLVVTELCDMNLFKLLHSPKPLRCAHPTPSSPSVRGLRAFVVSMLTGRLGSQGTCA